MGTQEGERDWVDVANDLLSKCHINLRLRKLTDCDANVFVALYENILGEKVPDYIAAPGSQEDDVHNIQSVIDSLALDYLQISLSHITGENVVIGDRESIKNLLEIFDGLLEYLNEEISEDSQNGEPNDSVIDDVLHGSIRPEAAEVTEQKDAMLERASQSSSGQSTVQSSKHSLHSWNAEETGSTNELIGLGDTARTFTAKQEAVVAVPPSLLEPVTTSDPLDTQASLPREPLHPAAIPLQPPYQTTTPHRPDAAPYSPSQYPLANGLSHRHTEEEAAPATAVNSRQMASTVYTNGQQSPILCHSPVLSERSASSRQRTRVVEEGEQLEPTNGGPRRVLFRTKPDVLFLTLPDDVGTTAQSPAAYEDEEDEEDVSPTLHQQNSRPPYEERNGLSSSRVGEDDYREPLSYHGQKNKQAEQELQDMSQKLSRRLEDLDQMLKRALGESGESSDVREDVREEDKQSHHSDSVMECRRTPGPHTDASQLQAAHRTRSLSPSPPRACHSVQGQPEGTSREALSLDDRRQANLTAPIRTRRQELRHKHSHRRHSELVSKAYEEELKKFENRERANLAKERLKAQEAEREYREAILEDIPQTPKPSPPKRRSHQSPRNRQTTQGRRRCDYPRKTQPMKVKDNDLLPTLLEEIPHLHISPHTMGRMWEQQLEQVDRLHAVSSSHSRHRSKLSSQVEEAQKKHDLLVEIIHKEQEHNKRLGDFKDRIQQQKSAQNRLKEQRQQIARAKKYHSDYHVQFRARLMRARSKEERMFRQVFEEGLELQKARLREQRAYAREQRLEHQHRHQDQIKSMENYYKDQFSLLAEMLAEERHEIQVRKKAQEKALLKMKRELRSRMEREIGELQKTVIQNDEDDCFRDLEVQRLRGRVQMASFQYNNGCLH